MSALPRNQLNDLVTTYREWDAYDRARSASSVRESLKRITATMRAAADCIAEYQQGGGDLADETHASAAWRHVNAILAESNPLVTDSAERPMIAAQATEARLRSWARAAEGACKKVPAPRYVRHAVCIVAENLISARLRKGLTVSSTENGHTVTDLRNIAKAAGNKSLTKAAASKVLQEVLRHGNEHR